MENNDSEVVSVKVEPLDELTSSLQVQSIEAENLAVDSLLDLSEITRAIQKSSAENIHELNAGFSKLERILKQKIAGGPISQPSRESRQKDKRNQPSVRLSQSNDKKTQKNDNREQEIAREKAKAKPVVTNSRENDIYLSNKIQRPLSHQQQKSDSRRALALTEISVNERDGHPEPEQQKPNVVSVENDSPVAKEVGISNFTPEDISQFKKGADGRLRHNSGRFASKAEVKKYQDATGKGASSPGSQSEDEKSEDKQSVSILQSVSKSIAKIAALSMVGSVSGQGSGAGTVAGVAMGGSYFLAAQEMATMLADVKERFSEKDINSFSDLKEVAKSKAISIKEAIHGTKTNGKAMATPMVSSSSQQASEQITTEKESVSSRVLATVANPVKALKGLFGAGGRNDQGGSGSAGTAPPETAQLIQQGAKNSSSVPNIQMEKSSPREQSADTANPSTIQAAPIGAQASRVAPVETPSNRVESAVAPSKAPGKVPGKARSNGGALAAIKNSIAEPIKSLTTKIKTRPNRAETETVTLLKASSNSEEQHHVEKIRALGEIKDAIDMKSSASAGSLLGDAFDAFGDRDKRGRKKGKGRGRGKSRGGTGRPSAARGGRFSRMPSAPGAFFGEAGAMAKPGAAAGGGLLKAGGSALRMGGAALSKLALPLTVAMAAFDGVSGYMDSDAQAKAFGLKEGQEASFGQKMSMATGSMLSLGGLTELIGISAEDIAKGVYKMGGGTIPTSAKEVMPNNQNASKTSETSKTSRLKEQDRTIESSKAGEISKSLEKDRASEVSRIKEQGMAIESSKTNEANRVSESGRSLDLSQSRDTVREIPLREPSSPAPVANSIEVAQPAIGQLGREKNAPPLVNVFDGDPLSRIPENRKLVGEKSSIAEVKPTPASMMVNSANIQDIEQIVAHTSYKEQMKSAEKQSQAPMALTDPEVTKLLRSIDKKLEKSKEKPKAGGHRATSNPGVTSVPTDFSDTRLRREANDF